MNNTMNSQHITKDIGEAAALLTQGIEMGVMQWKDKTAYFVFNSPQAPTIGHSYLYGDLKLSPRIFYDNLRMLKRQVLSNNHLKNKFREEFRPRR